MNRLIIVVKESLLGAFVSGVVGHVFYKTFLVTMIFSISGLSFSVINKKNRIKKHKQKIMISFKELLNSIYSALLSGKSFRNSLEQAIVEMRSINVEDPLLIYLEKLLADIQIGTSEVIAWKNFAECIEIEACDEFVDVLEETYASGGQITKVINRTCQILSDKIDLLLELDLMLSGKNFEFKIMMISPIVLLGTLSRSNESYMEMLYSTFIGRCVMTLVLTAMIFAYIVGKKIIQIEL